MITNTIAARIFILESLLNPEIIDEEGNVIEQGEPFITKAEAIKLLNARTLWQEQEIIDIT